MRHPVEHAAEVARLDYFESQVRGVPVQPFSHRHGVAHGDAFFLQEGFEGFFAEAFFVGVDKIVFVVEKDKPEDTPHIVGVVGVEKLCRPAFAGRREATQQEHARIGREKGRQWVGFDGRIHFGNG